MKEVDRRHAYSLITAWSFLRHRRADPNRDPNTEKAGGYRRTQWIAHRAESTQKRRKALRSNAFRRASYLHTQEVTGSSPAVSTTYEKSELIPNRERVRIFYFHQRYYRLSVGPRFCLAQNRGLCTFDEAFLLLYNSSINQKGGLHMEIQYIRVGDYYIPDLTLPEEPRPIGK